MKQQMVYGKGTVGEENGKVVFANRMLFNVHLGLVNGGPPPLNDGGTWNCILRSSSSEFPFYLVLVNLSFHLELSFEIWN